MNFAIFNLKLMKDRDQEEIEKIIFRGTIAALVLFVMGILGLLYVTFH